MRYPLLLRLKELEEISNKVTPRYYESTTIYTNKIHLRSHTFQCSILKDMLKECIQLLIDLELDNNISVENKKIEVITVESKYYVYF